MSIGQRLPALSTGLFGLFLLVFPAGALADSFAFVVAPEQSSHECTAASTEKAISCAMKKCKAALRSRRFGREDLQHLTFVIYRTPEVMRFSIDPHEDFVQVPTPLRKRPMMKASFPGRGRKHRAEPVPPVPNRLVADIDAPLEQNILDLSQRQRIADIHRHREADDLGRTVEISEGIAHRRRLGMPPARLKPIYSDNAHLVEIKDSLTT
jgi:hypothetical protein